MTHQLIKQEAKEGRWGATRCLHDCLRQCVFMVFARVRNHILTQGEVEHQRRGAAGADVLAFLVFFSHTHTDVNSVFFYASFSIT